MVNDYYGAKIAFPALLDNIMAALDKADAAKFSHEEILNPEA